MYNRFESDIHENENISDVLAALSDHNASLEDHIHLLEKVRGTQLRVSGEAHLLAGQREFSR